MPEHRRGLDWRLQRMFATGRFPTLARLIHDGTHPDRADVFDKGLPYTLGGITA